MEKDEKLSENCDEKCSSCPLHGKCAKEEIKKEKMERHSSAKNIIGILSGKGGVGKSFVSSYLAVLLARKGYKVGILDADITGPSIPYAFDLKYQALANNEGIILPGLSNKYKIRIISSNMLLANQDDPIMWKGPLIGDLVIQFFTKVYFGELDYLLIDMPPGTSDVALSVFQQIPLDGIVTVTTPQSLVSLIVEKASNMSVKMNVPILALVNNMAYIKCPKCSEKIYMYGQANSDIASQYNIPISIDVPFDRDISSFIDAGRVEDISVDYLDRLAAYLIGEN